MDMKEPLKDVDLNLKKLKVINADVKFMNTTLLLTFGSLEIAICGKIMETSKTN